VNDIAGNGFNQGQANVVSAYTSSAVQVEDDSVAQDVAPNTSLTSGVVDLSGASPNEERIKNILRSPLRAPIEALQEPLADLVSQLSMDHDIPILFDIQALDNAGISPDHEISLPAIGDISLRSALRLMLRQVEHAAYIIEDEVLLITTTDKANAKLTTRIYDVSNLGIAHEEIAEKMPDVVCHDTWQTNGSGEGEVICIGQKTIAVLQTQSVHEQVVDFLEQLHRHSERHRGSGSF
jgi:hypothetical protein